MDEFLGKFTKALARELAKELAKDLAKELRAANDDGWISQSESSLPVRVHCAAVRSRVARGLPDAMVDVKLKLFKMTREAMLEEMRARGQRKPLAKTSSPPTDKDQEPPTGVRDRIMRKLGRS